MGGLKGICENVCYITIALQSFFFKINPFLPQVEKL